MKILALDSSGLVASAAIVEDDVLIAEYTTDYKKTHSQTLLPMLDEIRQMIDLDLHTIDAIAISAGPGSFTGLRIGAATAKGLGLALNLPLVEVPTLEGLALTSGERTSWYVPSWMPEGIRYIPEFMSSVKRRSRKRKAQNINL